MSGRPAIPRIAVILAAGSLGLALLLVGGLTLVLSTETGTGWALSQLLGQVNSLPGQRVTVASTEGTLVSGLQLKNVDFQSNAAHVSVEQVGISWRPLSLLSARLSVYELLINNVQVELLAPDPAAEQADQPTGPLISFAPLPVVIDLEAVTIRSLVVQQLQQQLTVGELSLAAHLQEQSLELTSIDLSSDLIRFAGDLTLVLNDMLPIDAEVQWQFDGELYPGSGPASGMLTLAGNLASLQIQHQLQQPLALGSEGNIETGLAGNELNVNLTHRSDSLELPQAPIENLVLNNLNLTTVGGLESLQIAMTTGIDNELMPAITLALDADWQAGTLVLEDLQLATQTGQLSASGELTVGEVVAGALQYQLTDSFPLGYIDSQLPLEILNLSSSGMLEFNLADSVPQGSLQLTELSGEFGNYPFQGQGQIRYADEAFRFDNVQLSTAANQLVVAGVLADELDLNWRVIAPQLNQFIEELSGELQASGQVSGNLTDMQLIADIVAESVSFNGMFVDNLQISLQRQGQSIAGRLELADAGFRSEERTDNIHSLTLLIDGATAQHRVSLAATTDYGDVELELQGGIADPASIDWNGVLQEGRLDTDFGEWRTQSTSNLAFDSSSINLTDNCWLQNESTVCLEVSGSNQPGGFSLQFSSQASNYPLTVFNHPNLQAVGSELSLDAIPHLPEIVSLAGTVDAELMFLMDSNGSTTADVNLQPNDVFLTIRSTKPEVEPEPDSELGSVTTTANDIEELPFSEQIYALNNSRLTATLENGNWSLQAGTQISGLNAPAGIEPPSGTLDSQVRISSDGELTGALQANLGGIGWVGAFSQDVENLEGSLSGTVSLAGSLNEPRFSLDLQLADGQVSVLPLGITIEQIASSITSLDDGSIQLTTSARSGTGNLYLQGLLSDPFNTQRSLQAQVSGTDFRLAEIPDLNLVITPEVTVNADSQKVDITGSLHLPTLVINLLELPEQAVGISRDTVIIDYPPDQPHLARSGNSEQSTLFNLPVVTNLDISLGEQVSFNGFGLTTEVAGNLNVRQQENGTNLTYGELEIVSGQYALYGRSLQVRQGKLLFFGAYDNPALDIRATREVESTTVGVLMNGTLKNIQSQLFSSPALPDSDIIAILVTGKPFSEMGQQEGVDVVGAITNLGLSRSRGLTNQVREQLGLDTLAITNTGNINNSILTVGKYLTPDLFIRYGIGLFDHQSKLALDYTLTERITLQAETGEYQSVDLLYRVER